MFYYSAIWFSFYSILISVYFWSCSQTIQSKTLHLRVFFFRIEPYLHSRNHSRNKHHNRWGHTHILHSHHSHSRHSRHSRLGRSQSCRNCRKRHQSCRHSRSHHQSHRHNHRLRSRYQNWSISLETVLLSKKLDTQNANPVNSLSKQFLSTEKNGPNSDLSEASAEAGRLGHHPWQVLEKKKRWVLRPFVPKMFAWIDDFIGAKKIKKPKKPVPLAALMASNLKSDGSTDVIWSCPHIPILMITYVLNLNSWTRIISTYRFM